jgi:predicted nucleic acid-binding protein
VIIGDSSALVALSIMNRLDLLETVFGSIHVPQAVYDEVTISSKPQSKKLKTFLKDKIISVKINITQMGLGRGELEAIALYKNMDADFLLIDDRRAKSFAKLNDVNVIGSLGVMVLAKELGKIKTIREDLEKLLDSDVFISESLISRVLLSVGE